MTIKIVGAGFGRTGTTTMRASMEELGFDPCYHVYKLFSHPQDIEFWEKLDKGEEVDFDIFFKDYKAIMGFPGYMFYRQIINFYSDAKVILTIRDPEEWYEEAATTILVPERNPGNKALAEALRKDNPYLANCVDRFAELHHKLLHSELFEGRFGDKDFAIDRFIRRNEEVKRVVPPGRLLVYSVEEGWEPLCNFLNVPIPEKPFPHLNYPPEFHKPMKKELEIIRQKNDE